MTNKSYRIRFACMLGLVLLAVSPVAQAVPLCYDSAISWTFSENDASKCISAADASRSIVCSVGCTPAISMLDPMCAGTDPVTTGSARFLYSCGGECPVMAYLDWTITVYPVAAEPPQAVLRAPAEDPSDNGYGQVPIGTYCVLDASGSTPKANVTYTWDFGDSPTTKTTRGSQVFHRYATEGVYPVQVTVRDGANRTSVAAKTIRVKSMVACVPWAYNEGARADVPHVVLQSSGTDPETQYKTRLKAVVYTLTDGALEYQWRRWPADWGEEWTTISDNPQQLELQCKDRCSIDLELAFTDAPGTMITYEVRVRYPNAGAIIGSDTYLLQVVAACQEKPELGQQLSPEKIADRDARINMAIDEGLWWLHTQQDMPENPNKGRWPGWAYGVNGLKAYGAGTSEVLHAMQIYGHLPTRGAAIDPLSDTVVRGLLGLMDRLTVLHLSDANDPDRFEDYDTNDDDWAIMAYEYIPGAYCNSGMFTPDNCPGYTTGMIMNALAASYAPDLCVETSALRPNGGLSRWLSTLRYEPTFLDLVQGMGDMLAYGQEDDGGWCYSSVSEYCPEPGRFLQSWSDGWRKYCLNYHWQGRWSDNSVAQWPAIGFMAASKVFGLSSWDSLKEPNYVWVASTLDAAPQSGDEGGFTYDGGYGTQECHAMTPSALIQLAYNGHKDELDGAILWNNGKAWVERHWLSTYTDKSFNEPYAYYALSKALRLGNVPELLCTDGYNHDWYSDLARVLVDPNLPSRHVPGDEMFYYPDGNPSDRRLPRRDGNWEQSNNAPAAELATAWNLLVLAPAVFDLPGPHAEAVVPSTVRCDQDLKLNATPSTHPLHQQYNNLGWIQEYDWYIYEAGSLPPSAPTYHRYGFNHDSEPDPATGVNIVLHSFASDCGTTLPKTYKCKLVVKDNYGKTDESPEYEVTVTASNPPEASITQVASVLVNTPVEFSGQESHDNDPGDYVAKMEWDFSINNDATDFSPPDEVVLLGLEQQEAKPRVSHTFTSAGQKIVGLRVYDFQGEHCSDPDYAVVTVTDPQHPPVPKIIVRPLPVYEGQPTTLDGSESTDEDGDWLSYSWEVQTETDPVTYDVAAPVHTWPVTGEYTVKLTVDDHHTPPVSTEVTVEVKREPVLRVWLNGPTTLDLMQDGMFVATATTDSEPITQVEWDWGDGQGFRTEGTSPWTPWHSWSDAGPHAVTVRVTDRHPHVVTATLNVTVLDVTHQPAEHLVAVDWLESLTGKCAGPESYGAYDLYRLRNISGGSIAGDIYLGLDQVQPNLSLNQVWAYYPDPANVPYNWSSWMCDTIPSVWRICATLTPLPLRVPWTGTTPVPLPADRIDITDVLTGGHFAPRGEIYVQARFDATSANRAALKAPYCTPIVYITSMGPRFVSTPILTATEGVRYRYTAQAVDGDGDVVTYALADDTQMKALGIRIHPTLGIVDWTPGQRASEGAYPDGATPGTYKVCIIASDGRPGGDTQQPYVITVAPVNVAPVISSIPKTTWTYGENPFTDEVSASDPDGDLITFDLLAAPDTMTIELVNGTPTINWPVPTVGPHAVTIAVSDGPNGHQTTQSYVLRVVESPDCIVLGQISPPTATEGKDFSYTVPVTTGTDLKFSLAVAPEGMEIGSTSGVITWRPSYTSEGDRTVKIVITSGEYCQLEAVFTVHVDPANGPPTIDRVPNQEIHTGQRFSLLMNASDPDGDPLVFVLAEPPAGMTIRPTVGIIEWDVPYDAQEHNTIRVRAVDPSGLWDECSFQIKVLKTETPPSFVSDPNYDAAEGERYTYQALATDLDGDTLYYRYSIQRAGEVLVQTGWWEDTNKTGCPVNWPVDDTKTIDHRAAEFNPYTVRVEVQDQLEGGLTDVQEFDLYVEPRNAAPVIDTIADQPVHEGAMLTPVTVDEGAMLTPVTVVATDPDGDNLTYSIKDTDGATRPADMSIHPYTGLITWKAPYTYRDDQGTDTYGVPVTVQVRDGVAIPVEASFTITVTRVNKGPVIEPTEVEDVPVGSTYTLTITAKDPNKDAIALTHSIPLPDHMTFEQIDGTTAPTESASARIVFTPDADLLGPHLITVIATSPGNPSVTRDITINVVRCDDPPTIDPVLATVAKANPATGEEYSWQLTTDPAAGSVTFTPLEKPDLMNITAAGLITWSPTTADIQAIPHDVLVRATKTGDASCFADLAFQVTVTAAGCDRLHTFEYAAPVLSRGRVATWTPVIGTVTCTPLTYQIISKSHPDIEIDPQTGVLMWPTATTEPYQITVRATDTSGSYVDAYPGGNIGNAVPVFKTVPPPDPTAILEQDYTYTAEASDADTADVLTISLVSGPAGMTLTSTLQAGSAFRATLSWKPKMAQAGTHEVTIKVEDGRGGWQTLTYHLTASNDGANSPPEITSEPANADGEQYRYQAVAVDPDGDLLTWSLDIAPVGATVGSASGIVAWDMPEDLPNGTYDFKIRVVDGRGGWATQTFRISVQAGAFNNPPSIDSEPPMTAKLDTLYIYGVSASDPDGDPLSYTLEQSPTGMTIDSGTGVIRWTPTAADLGTHEVAMRVDDGNGGWAKQLWTLFVSEDGENRPPRITSMPAFVATPAAEYVYAVTAVDDDPGDTATLTVSMQKAPAGATMEDGTITWLPTMAQLGTHEFVVRVEDHWHAWATQTFSVTVSKTGGNHAPQITSEPATRASTTAPYVYTVFAIDPDGDPVTYQLDQGPTNLGMTFDPATRQLCWPENAGVIGTYTIVVRASDDQGAWTTQTFPLTVSEKGDNRPPHFTSTPETTALDGGEYTYAARAVDEEDGTALKYYASVKTFAGASVTDDVEFNEQTGDLHWHPVGVTGMYTVTVKAEDSAGGTATQTFDLAVSTVDGGNEPPDIVSEPGYRAIAGQTYVYEVLATDVDDTVLTYTKVSGVGDFVPPNSPTFQYAPALTDVGATPEVTIQVSDPHGNYVTQTFVLHVESNEPPVILSAPVNKAWAGFPYTYKVKAEDPDDLVLVYEVYEVDEAGAPIASSIDFDESQKDLVKWSSPQASDIGPHTVVIRVTDPWGAFDEQKFVLTVANPSEDRLPPEVSIKVEPGIGATTAQTVLITVEAVDDLAVKSKSLTIENLNDLTRPVETLTLDPAGRVRYPTPTSATTGAFRNLADAFKLSATATDNNDNVGTATESLKFREAGVDTDVTAPVAEITSPKPDEVTGFPATISTPTSIIGKAYDDNFYYYTLSYRRAGESEFVEFAKGYTSVGSDSEGSEGELGTLDPTKMVNGLYDVALYVEDSFGNSNGTSFPYVVDGQMKVGNFTMSFVDVQVPVAGIPITVTRTYDSRVKTKGDFGIGWSMDLSSIQLQKNMPKFGRGTRGDSEEGGWTGEGGLDWQTNTVRLSSMEPCLASITWPDGKVEQFLMSVTVTDAGFSFNPVEKPSVTFDALGTATSKLAVAGGGAFIFTAIEGGYGYLGRQSGVVWPVWSPEQYVLTTLDGRELRFDESKAMTAKLVSVRDCNNNTLKILPSGVEHSSGKSVLFKRDEQGRITEIQDPEYIKHGPPLRPMRFAYDERGDLVQVTDRDDNMVQYRYNRNHDLIEVIDPRGISAARNIYDENGRLTEIIDADGKSVSYGYPDNPEPGLHTQTVTDQLGRPTTYVYNDKGLVTSKKDWLLNEWLYTYDGNGNQESETDPFGNVTRCVYDGNNLKTRMGPAPVGATDPGPTTHYTYYDDGRLWTAKDANASSVEDGKITENKYDERGNLETTSNPLGQVTRYEYDLAGRVTSTQDPLGQVTSFEYDEFGNVLKQTDPKGNEVTFTYDENGNKLSETRMLAVDGQAPALCTTWYEYDGSGRLTKTYEPQVGDASTSPSGKYTETLYNSMGKVWKQIDRRDQVTEYEYDNRGNLRLTKYADGTEEETTYDEVGRVKTARSRDGRMTTYAYDTVNIDGKDYARTTTTVDGQSTQTVYDQLGRIKRKIQPRDLATTPLNLTTSYEHTYAGQIQAVTDHDGNRIEYKYDANGNRIEVKVVPVNPPGDARVQQTITYDALNRPICTVFADGTQTTTKYNDAGLKVETVDQAGKKTAYGYDALGQLTTVTDALGNVTKYEYDAAGNRTKQTDAELHTTVFKHDQRGRIVERTLPIPSSRPETINYDDDANITTRTDFLGRKTVYRYDGNKRLMRKDYREPNSGSVSFTYTIGGQRLTDATNHGITYYQYDPQGRVSQRLVSPLQADMDRDGTIGANDLSLLNESLFSCEGDEDYNPAADLNGNGCVDIYDQFTLTSQLGTTAAAAGKSVGYRYDEAGNRTAVITAGGVTHYEYDNLNRLWKVTAPGHPADSSPQDLTNHLLESSDAPKTVYAYDGYGNRKSITYPNGTITTYAYDDLNRLTNVETRRVNDGSLIAGYTYTLGLSGNREQVVETGEAGPARTVTYTYDAVYRLKKEEVADSTGAWRTSEYTYDKVGNRKTRLDKTDGAQSLTTYIYDNNDRLITEQTETQPLAATAAMPAPMPLAQYGFNGYGLLCLATLLTPLGLLLPAGPGVGKRARRRCFRNATLCLLLAVMMVASPEQLHAVQVQAQANQAMVAAVLATGSTTQTTEYGYDDNGNLISRTVDGVLQASYTYNHDNQMNFSEIGSSFSFYRYDADGLRDYVDQDHIHFWSYLWDKGQANAQVLTETRTDGEYARYVTQYVNGDEVIRQKRQHYYFCHGNWAVEDPAEPGSYMPPVSRYYHYDGQMSVRQLTAEPDGTKPVSPELTDTYTYSAFGSQVASTGNTSNPFRYTGQMLDEHTGWYYLRARDYDPGVGRFTTMDTYGGSDFDPSSLHKYAYCANDPLDLVDPGGHEYSLGSLCVAAAISAGMNAILGAAMNIREGVRGMLGGALGAATTAFFTGLIAAPLVYTLGPVGAAIGGFVGSALGAAVDLLITHGPSGFESQEHRWLILITGLVGAIIGAATGGAMAWRVREAAIKLYEMPLIKEALRKTAAGALERADWAKTAQWAMRNPGKLAAAMYKWALSELPSMAHGAKAGWAALQIVGMFLMGGVAPQTTADKLIPCIEWAEGVLDSLQTSINKRREIEIPS